MSTSNLQTNLLGRRARPLGGDGGGEIVAVWMEHAEFKPEPAPILYIAYLKDDKTVGVGELRLFAIA